MPNIFISYRRDDSQDISDRIFEKLDAHFGKGNLFMDIDTIPFGVDFRQHIAEAVGRCNVILAIIGKNWLNASHREGPNQGKRRLDDPTDFVRIELQTGLDRNIPVIPVLVGGASVPGEQQLPDELKPLAFRNAAEVRSGRDFAAHIDRLIRGIEAHPVFQEIKRREKEEAVRKRQELERLQKEGETKLEQMIRAALDRTQGKLTQDDLITANEICKRHRILTERAKQIVIDVKGQWQKEHHPKSDRQPGNILTNSLAMRFAWIPPGTFLMGSPKEEKGRELYAGANETQHKVTLTKGFYMGIHPITCGQFATFVENSGYKTQAELEGGAHIRKDKWKLDAAAKWNNPGFEQTNDDPVVCVSWNDGVAFAKWLSEREMKSIRLPTEAEWEYACRAGTTTPFHFGETISTDQANYDGNYTYGNGKKGEYRQQTTSVGCFPANAWGLYDMHGNVWEWCQEWLGDNLQYTVSDSQGPKAREFRVLRGGSWCVDPALCRSAFRSGYGAGRRFNNCGFRLCFCLE